jgi:hypothetical protein
VLKANVSDYLGINNMLRKRGTNWSPDSPHHLVIIVRLNYLDQEEPTCPSINAELMKYGKVDNKM